MIQFVANIFQRQPPRIFYRLGAVTLLHIQVLATVRAETPAIVATDRLQGKRQQNLLQQDILQQQALTLIITDFSLGRGHRKLFPPCIRSLGTVQQIKLVGYILYNWFQAAGAGQLDSSVQTACNAYVLYYLMLAVLLFDQLSAPSGTQRFHLLQILSQIKHTGTNFFLEINGMLFQFLDFDEHQAPPAPPTPYREDRGSTL